MLGWSYKLMLKIEHYFTDRLRDFADRNPKFDFSFWLDQLSDRELIRLGAQMWVLEAGHGLITEEQVFDANHLVFAYLDIYKNRRTLREGERVKILELINNEIKRVIQKRGLA